MHLKTNYPLWLNKVLDYVKSERTVRFLKMLLIIVSCLYIFLYVYTVYYRLQYPFELEWIEGGIHDQVQRIVEKKPIYVAPSIEFVPFLYTPLYFSLSSLISPLLGGGLFPLRLVSFVASLVSFVAIFFIVYRETKNLLAAIVATGLFAATFRITGVWMDIARVDSLFLALFLFFIFIIRGNKTATHAILAGILLAMAYLSKQTMLVISIPIILWLFFQTPKYSIILLVSALLIIGTTTIVLQQQSDGWYLYYTYHLLSQQTEWFPRAFFTFWGEDLLANFPLAIVCIIIASTYTPIQKNDARIDWLVICVGALAGSFLTRIKVGGYDNVLLPIVAVISILFGFSIYKILKISAEHKNRFHGIIYTVGVLQLFMIFYNPITQIPSPLDMEYGLKFIRLLEETEGPVYLVDHGYISTLAGKESYAHHAAIWDVRRGTEQSEGNILLSHSLQNAIEQQFFSTIILDSKGNYCCDQIETYYDLKGMVFEEEREGETGFYPVTGSQRRPTYIYTAKRLR
ncbi:hypothetical protein OSCT_1998 [Oscillochloris trichoides DG-6]|uniref:Glycosyltransferase RgtA/B/C/D-like domain-containing protein n=1 Tax=Oscillochloris trichoides DG-6 TaxID=765420 RepID=E1IF97_9CHLR|nr:glycosyltransferase family 39 protein [Oscillochloris trichoides]EFO80137.1 hypothetical protein OSCT_1998 [Oscillochloris trichoides DG-6]